MRKLIVILAVLLIAIPLFAENAVIKELKGRVEIQAPGSGWQSASAGDILPQGASLSTGFGSSAVLEVGASTVTVDALTRMKLEELVQSQGAQTTGLFLRVGKVKAEVKRDAGLSHDFRLRSPSSTAAVRGTAFTFDGDSVTVDEGVVSMISAAIAREVSVSQGESCKVASNGKPSTPVVERVNNSSTDGTVVKKENSSAQSGASGTSGASGNSGGSGGSPKFELYGDINITVQ